MRSSFSRAKSNEGKAHAHACSLHHRISTFFLVLTLSFVESVCDFAKALTQLQEQEVAAQQRLLDAVQHKNLPVPAALHIVRACGVPRLNFVSRTTPPEQAASMLQVCDHSLATAVCERISLPRAAAGAPETAAMVQMQLPIPARRTGYPTGDEDGTSGLRCGGCRVRTVHTTTDRTSLR